MSWCNIKYKVEGQLKLQPEPFRFFKFSRSYRQCWASCSTWLDGPTGGTQTTPPCPRPEDGSSPLEGRRRNALPVCICVKEKGRNEESAKKHSEIKISSNAFLDKSNTFGGKVGTTMVEYWAAALLTMVGFLVSPSNTDMLQNWTWLLSIIWGLIFLNSQSCW